jgi:VIT1/CCC1 family predicted Fe2+/Mn2+ transporter
MSRSTSRSAHPQSNDEHHLIHRAGWLRAAVLGANDGIVSTGSLIVGVAAAAGSHGEVLVAGVAALVAGAMSMAAGEYVSVSSQSDTERADIEKEKIALRDTPDAELHELALIYEARGLPPALASEVANVLMKADALKAHARDEIGISESVTARPVQAALASAGSFVTGAAFPLAVAAVSPLDQMIWLVTAASLIFLALLGVLSARAGGAPVFRAVLRVTLWGAFAMAVTALIGRLFGAIV